MKPTEGVNDRGCYALQSPFRIFLLERFRYRLDVRGIRGARDGIVAGELFDGARWFSMRPRSSERASSDSGQAPRARARDSRFGSPC